MKANKLAAKQTSDPTLISMPPSITLTDHAVFPIDISSQSGTQLMDLVTSFLSTVGDFPVAGHRYQFMESMDTLILPLTASIRSAPATSNLDDPRPAKLAQRLINLRDLWDLLLGKRGGKQRHLPPPQEARKCAAQAIEKWLHESFDTPDGTVATVEQAKIVLRDIYKASPFPKWNLEDLRNPDILKVAIGQLREEAEAATDTVSAGKSFQS